MKADKNSAAVNILCLESGGPKGYTEAIFLKALEEEIARQAGRHIPLYEIFDLMVGTSIGGVICCLLSGPQYKTNKITKAKELCDDYIKNTRKAIVLNKKSFFGIRGPLMQASKMERQFAKQFGDMDFRESKTNVVVTSLNINDMHPVLFKSYDCNEYISIKDVLMATCSVPMGFPPHEFKSANGKDYLFVDGIVFANLPLMIAIEEAESLFGEDSDPHKKILHKNSVIVCACSMTEKVDLNKKDATEGGMFYWLLRATSIYSSAQKYNDLMQAEKKYKEQLYVWMPKTDEKYRHPSDLSDESFAAMERATNELLDEGKNKIEYMVNKILKNKGIKTKG